MRVALVVGHDVGAVLSQTPLGFRLGKAVLGCGKSLENYRRIGRGGFEKQRRNLDGGG